MDRARLLLKGIENWWSDRVIRYPWQVICLAVALVLSLGSGARLLMFDTNYRVFFSDTNPELQTLDRFESNYTRTDNIMIIVRPPGDEVFTRETLEVVQQITEEAWSIPFARRVDSITNFQDTRGQADELIVEDLVESPAELDASGLAQKKQRALAEPLLVDALISPDGSTTGINVTIHYELESNDEVPRTVAHARALVDRIKAEHPDYYIALSGLAMLNNAFAESGEQDMQSLVPGMYLVLTLAAVFILRSLVAAACTLVIIGVSTVAAMGAAGYLGIPLSPISAAAPTIILTLAIADSIHILTQALRDMRAGIPKREAFRLSLSTNLVPVTVTSVTTAIGFLTLNFAESPVFGHLGTITAMGIAAAWIFSLSLLPALIMVLPLKVKPRPSNRAEGARLARFASQMAGNHRTVLAIAAVVVVALTSIAPSVKLDDNFVKYFDFRIPFRADTEFMMANLTGTYQVEYSVETGEPSGVNEPEYLQHLEEFTAWLRARPEVRHVYSYSDIARRINKNLHQDQKAYYRIPENRQQAAQYLLLYELSLPYGLGLEERVTLNKSGSRLSVTMNDISMGQLRTFLADAREWKEANLPTHISAEPTGVAVLFSYISQRNIETMMLGNLTSLIAISLLILVMLRSVRLGVISLFTNVAPIAIGFGLWALLVGVIGMAAAAVAAVALGVIVDATVHFLVKYQRSLHDGKDNTTAISDAARTVGMAVLATTLITIAGFAVLAFSSFSVNQHMGILTAVALAVGLLFCVTVTPALLTLGHRSKGQRSKQGATNVTDTSAIDSLFTHPDPSAARIGSTGARGEQ